MTILGFDKTAASKLLSRLLPRFSFLAVMFIFGLSTGWYRPNLSSDLRFGLEILGVALIGIVYWHVAGLWWRTRDPADRAGIHADFTVAIIDVAMVFGSLIYLFTVRKLNLATRNDIYIAVVVVIIVIPLTRDLITTWMAKHELGRLRPVTPTIDFFIASADTVPVGGTVTLRWRTANARTATLDGATVATTGSQVVSPAGGTGTVVTYTLVANGTRAGSSGPATVTVTLA